jgi:hypothetical protein
MAHTPRRPPITLDPGRPVSAPAAWMPCPLRRSGSLLGLGAPGGGMSQGHGLGRQGGVGDLCAKHIVSAHAASIRPQRRGGTNRRRAIGPAFPVLLAKAWRSGRQAVRTESLRRRLPRKAIVLKRKARPLVESSCWWTMSGSWPPRYCAVPRPFRRAVPGKC